MPDTPEWPCNLTVAVVASTSERAERVARQHPAFFQCRRARPVTPAIVARGGARGYTFDAVWIVDESAYNLDVQQALIWNFVSSRHADKKLVHRSG